MAKEEIKIEEIPDEQTLSVGGENELKLKEQQDELKVQPQNTAEEEKQDEDEKNEASLENYPDSDGYGHSAVGKMPEVKDQDISQYLWDTLLKCINNFNQWLYERMMNATDKGISKREIGPKKPEAPKEEKVQHTKERGIGLYDAGKAANDEFAASVSKMPAEISGNIKDAKEKDKLKNVMVHAHKIAFDMSVSEFLHEKMAKDKDFDFAAMDTKEIIKSNNEKIKEKYDRLMTGVMATFYYSSNIENSGPQETLKACDEYLNIRENESNDIKKLVTDDLKSGNFVANGKNPNRDIGVKLNAYNRSFDNDAVVMNSALKETATFLQNSNLTAEEKVNLAEFQKSINLAQKFEANTVMNLQKQIKALAPAYQQCLQRRDNLKAFKERLGLKSLSPKTLQIHANNAIIQAISKAKGGRR